MIETLVLLAIFTTLIVFGIHAVTRQDKLFWFLGVRNHFDAKYIALESQMNEKLDAAFDLYDTSMQSALDKVDAIFEERKLKGLYGDSMLSDKDKDAIKDAILEELELPIERKYEYQKDVINKQFAPKIEKMLSYSKRLEQSRLFKLLSYFAPALTECLTCMASFWGTLVFATYFSGAIESYLLFIPIAMPLFILSVAGLNTIVAKITA